MKNFTINNLLIAVFALFSSANILTAQQVCNQFDYFYADITAPNGVKQTDIYSVLFAGNDAILTAISEDIPYGAHIAYNDIEKLLYIINEDDGSVQTFDPITHDWSPVITPNVVLSHVTAASISEDGKLLLGSQDDGVIYLTNFNTNPYTVTVYDSGNNISGGDLVFTNTALFLASKPSGYFYVVYPGIANGLLGQVDRKVTGLAKAEDGETVMLSAQGNTSFLQYDIDLSGGVNQIGEYNALLNGEPFTLNNGDMASGCSSNEPSVEIGCYGFEVLDFVQGLKTNGQPVPADRSNPAAALGEPDRSNAPGGFVSLGVGGQITIGFSGVVMDEPGNDIKIWETSFSGDVCGKNDDEYAEIELSQDGVNFVSVGMICRDGEVDMADAGLPYIVAIRITNSSLTGTPDGYDVDGVEALYGCSDFPVVETGECYATEVVEYVQGTSKNGGAIATNRTNATKALGAPERADQLVFVSLGYGGSLTLAFDGSIPNGPGADIEIVETSYNTTSCSAYPEYADVYVSINGIDWFMAGTVCKFDPFIDISDAGAFPYVNFVKIVNNNTLTTTPDGFDVDGVVALHNCIDVVEEDNIPTNPFVSNEETQTFISVYPNPTSSTTSIEFIPNSNSLTTVEVLDMGGRLVKTLLNKKVHAGETYTLDFDGSGLPNGIYIARFNDGENVVFNKIMIAK